MNEFDANRVVETTMNSVTTVEQNKNQINLKNVLL